MTIDTDFEHALKNYMAIILGYTDLLLDECGPDDARRVDLLEIQKAAGSAIALIKRPDGTGR